MHQGIFVVRLPWASNIRIDVVDGKVDSVVGVQDKFSEGSYSVVIAHILWSRQVECVYFRAEVDPGFVGFGAERFFIDC